MYDVTVILNKRFANLNCVVDKIPHLVHLLSKVLSVQILTHPVPDASVVEGRVVITIKNLEYKSVHTNNSREYTNKYIGILEKLCQQDRKLIGYFNDVDIGDPGKDDVLMLYHYNMLRQVLELTNRVLVAYPSPFLRKFPTQRDKMVFFPQFIAPTYRYSNLPFNTEPIPKCVVAGYDVSVYKHTKGYITAQNSPLVHRIPHPGYGPIGDRKLIVGDAWAEELNKYLCGYAGATSRDYIISKYYEIPAAGSLLLGTHGSDLKHSGFEDGVNFIKVTRDNFFSKLQHIVNSPKEYNNIRQAGRDLVFSKHTVDHRLETLLDTIKEL